MSQSVKLAGVQRRFFVTFPYSRMMISAQMVCTSSPRIPLQLGIRMSSPVALSPFCRPGGLNCSSGFQKGRGSSTLATKQAFSSGDDDDDAADAEVPAKDIGGHDFTGTKIVEFMDPISPTKFASLTDDQLPPLLSMVTDGLPPLQQSSYVHEAEKRLHKYIERYQSVISFDTYCRLGLSAASYWHPGVINVDRLVAMSFNYALLGVLDDLFFDTKDEFLQDQYGISRSACGSSQKMHEYLDYLDAIFGQEVQPSNTAPLIETLMWESGRAMLELSNPEWFKNYVASVVDQHHASAASQNLCFQDLESYTIMRNGNVGGKFIQLLIEFANDSYLPGILRATPYLKSVTTATSIHIGFVNDVFSYHMEISEEQNPRNLVTMLMECEGKTFVQAVHMAIRLVKTYTCAILDLEAECWNSTLQNHLQDIKALIAGNIYYSFMDKRYRHPNSIFPELRDMKSSWKILPHSKDPSL